MKDIEKALTEDYGKASDMLTFEDKEQLLGLYRSKKRPRTFKRTAAIAVALAAILMAAGITAGAVMNPSINAEIRKLIGLQTSDLDLTDTQINDIAQRLGVIGYDVDDLERSPLHLDVNNYGETIGEKFFEGDLVKYAFDNNDSNVYFYRYDFGFTILEAALTPEEKKALYNSERYDRLTAKDSETGYNRSWIYVFDKDGMKILGKLDSRLRYYSNSDLEKDDVADYLISTDPYGEYDKFVKERIEYKKEHGIAPETPREYVPIDLAEENIEINVSLDVTERPILEYGVRYDINEYKDIVVSDDAFAESSDPSVAEAENVICTGYKTSTPHTRVELLVHKLGSTIITIHDGDKEYRYKWSIEINPVERQYFIKQTKLD